MNANLQLDQLPAPAIAGIVALIVVQLALQVAALVQLGRTPSDRVTLGGRRWAWAIIILLGEILGPILWFAAGRTPEKADDPSRGDTASSDASGRAADVLYGGRTGQPK